MAEMSLFGWNKGARSRMLKGETVCKLRWTGSRACGVGGADHGSAGPAQPSNRPQPQGPAGRKILWYIDLFDQAHGSSNASVACLNGGSSGAKHGGLKARKDTWGTSSSIHAKQSGRRQVQETACLCPARNRAQIRTLINWLSQCPTRNCVMYPKRPNTFKSQITTAITTTVLRIPLIWLCMGMRLISHSNTPTTTRVSTTVTSDISYTPLLYFATG